MKNIAALCAALVMGCGAASAQYLCQEQGTVMTYTETANRDGKSESADYTSTVISVETGADGVISTRLEELHKVPGNELAEIKSYSGYTYNPATGLTVDQMLSGTDYKDMMMNMMIEGARAAGQNVSESDIANLDKAIRVKGDLFLNLPAEPDPSAKVPNQAIKLNIETMSMSMNLWEVKYLGYEDLEVPAGKFDQCMKVSYVVKTTTPESNEKNYCTEWFAKGVGSVKSVTADKKGNVQSETVLKEIKK